MTKMESFQMKPLSILLVVALTTAMSGCYSIYHATMREYSKPKNELLLMRLSEAQRTLDETQTYLVAAAQLSTTLNHLPKEERAPHVHRIDVQLNKAELGAWNTHRRILAVHDWLQHDDAESALSSTKKAILHDLISEMEAAQADLYVAMREFRIHLEALGDFVDDRHMERFAAAIAEMEQPLQQAIQRSRRVSGDVDQFIDSVDDYEIAAVK